MWTVWDIIIGGRRGPGAASGDRFPPDHTGGDRVSPALSAVCRLWGTHPSAVASHDAEWEFWAAGASDGGVFDGADGGESARGAGDFGDALSDRGERGEYRDAGTCSECGISGARG